jgi:hypothetical protein
LYFLQIKIFHQSSSNPPHLKVHYFTSITTAVMASLSSPTTFPSIFTMILGLELSVLPLDPYHTILPFSSPNLPSPSITSKALTHLLTNSYDFRKGLMSHLNAPKAVDTFKVLNLEASNQEHSKYLSFIRGIFQDNFNIDALTQTGWNLTIFGEDIQTFLQWILHPLRPRAFGVKINVGLAVSEGPPASISNNPDPELTLYNNRNNEVFAVFPLQNAVVNRCLWSSPTSKAAINMEVNPLLRGEDMSWKTVISTVCDDLMRYAAVDGREKPVVRKCVVEYMELDGEDVGVIKDDFLMETNSWRMPWGR